MISYTPSETPASARSEGFTRKAIEVQFDVVNPGGGVDTVLIPEGHRIRAGIAHAGLASGSELNMEIWGLTKNTMNRLCYVDNLPNSVVPAFRNQSDTTVIVRAGDYGKPKPTVFVGNIQSGFASYNNSEGKFTVRAVSIAPLAAQFDHAVSYPGPWDVVTMLSDICARAGIQLVDHGGWTTNRTLSNQYVEGSASDKIDAVVSAAKGTHNYEPIAPVQTKDGSTTGGILHVWGPGYSGMEEVAKGRLPLVSRDSGLLGYPDYTAYGMKVRTIFRPDIQFYSPILVVSNYVPAAWAHSDQYGMNSRGQQISSGEPWDGTWLPYSITHDISSELPNGPWETSLECQRSDTGAQYGLPKQ